MWLKYYKGKRLVSAGHAQGPIQLPPPLSRPLIDAAPTPRARSPETRLPAGLRACPEPESDQTTGQKAKDTQPLGKKKP